MHIFFIVLLMVCISICGHLILNALSMSYAAASEGFHFNGSKHHRHSLVEILPRGFSLFVIVSSIFYAVGFDLGWALQQQSLFNQAFLITGLVAVLPWALGARKQIDDPGHNKPTLRQSLIYYAPVVFVVGISSVVLGRYPIFVSDDFGHLTIINRMIESGSLGNPYLYMPDDANYHTFFPWHGVLASIGTMLGYEALETFAAAKAFLSATAVMSFISFCLTVFRNEKKIHFYVFCCAIVYATLSPEIFIFHGVGDYRGVIQILMFQAARIIWTAAFFRHTDIGRYVAFIFIMLAVALMHVIDIAIFLMMFFPYACYVNLRAKDKNALLMLGILGCATGAIALAVKVMFYSTVSSMPFTYSVTIVPYLKYYISRVDYEFGIPLIIIALAAPLISRRFRDQSSVILWWPAGALLSTLLLGSANPLLAGIYAKVISADLMERTMYSFPLAVPLGICLAYLISQAATLLRERKFHYSILIMLIVLGAIGRQVWFRYGLNGEPSYAWPGDEYSLLAKQQDLFKYIASLDHKLILTDLVTSAPITAVSSNYTYTNRPWVEINRGRISESMMMMQAAGTGRLAPLFCKNGIDILILNPNAPFNPQKHAGWVFDDFYRSGGHGPTEKHFSLVADIDGAAIYSFDRKNACGLAVKHG